MAKFWVWQLDNDGDVVAGTLEPSEVDNVSFEDGAAEAFVKRYWSDWDYPDEVDVVVLKQVEGRTFKDLLPEREVWTVAAHQDVTFAAFPKDDE